MIEPSGIVDVIPVTFGIEDARRVEIHSGALKSGDEVVVGPRSGLKQGLKVLPRMITLASDRNVEQYPDRRIRPSPED